MQIQDIMFVSAETYNIKIRNVPAYWDFQHSWGVLLWIVPIESEIYNEQLWNVMPLFEFGGEAMWLH